MWKDNVDPRVKSDAPQKSTRSYPCVPSKMVRSGAHQAMPTRSLKAKQCDEMPWSSQAHHLGTSVSQRFKPTRTTLPTLNIGRFWPDAVLNRDKVPGAMRTRNTASPSLEKETLLATSLTWFTRRGFNLTPWSCECRSVPDAQSEFHDAVCARS